jgi:hypothetical protein
MALMLRNSLIFRVRALCDTYDRLYKPKGYTSLEEDSLMEKLFVNLNNAMKNINRNEFKEQASLIEESNSSLQDIATVLAQFTLDSRSTFSAEHESVLTASPVGVADGNKESAPPRYGCW